MSFHVNHGDIFCALQLNESHPLSLYLLNTQTKEKELLSVGGYSFIVLALLSFGGIWCVTSALQLFHPFTTEMLPLDRPMNHSFLC